MCKPSYSVSNARYNSILRSSFLHLGPPSISFFTHIFTFHWSSTSKLKKNVFAIENTPQGLNISFIFLEVVWLVFSSNFSSSFKFYDLLNDNSFKFSTLFTTDLLHCFLSFPESKRLVSVSNCLLVAVLMQILLLFLRFFFIINSIIFDIFNISKKNVFFSCEFYFLLLVFSRVVKIPFTFHTTHSSIELKSSTIYCFCPKKFCHIIYYIALTPFVMIQNSVSAFLFC